MRCLTITLNPAVDTTYWLGELTPGCTNRVHRIRRTPAGKGVNVARVLRTLGHDVVATGFLGGDNGAFIDDALRAQGVHTDFVRLESGSTRSCVTLIDDSSRSCTEVLEPGPALSHVDRERFLDRLERLLPGTDAIVIAGSISEGATPDFLEAVMNRVRASARRLFVDASGTTLSALLAHGPDMVKPNEHEMAMLMGRVTTMDEQIAFAREQLIGRMMPDDGQVLLTLGKSGAVLIGKDRVLVATAPLVMPVNTVGCGDAVMAGFVGSWMSGYGDVVALRHAIACGSAAALCEVAGEIHLEEQQALLAGVHVQHRDDVEVSLG